MNVYVPSNPMEYITRGRTKNDFVVWLLTLCPLSTAQFQQRAPLTYDAIRGELGEIMQQPSVLFL